MSLQSIHFDDCKMMKVNGSINKLWAQWFCKYKDCCGENPKKVIHYDKLYDYFLDYFSDSDHSY